MQKFVCFFVMLTVILLGNVLFAQDHLVISEIAVTPTPGEFVEIFNPTSDTVDLSNYYLTDATFAGGGAFYYKIVTGNGGGGDFFDFNAWFPDGATIAPGEFQTIAIAGDSLFFDVYGVLPTYELYEDSTDFANDVPDMREATPGSIATPFNSNRPSGLTNSGEVVILYSWDGVSDLVQDGDYVVWGDKVEAVDKTGVRIDSDTDADSDSSEYLPDTAIGSQIVVASSGHAFGNSWQRIDPTTEVGETTSGGNGITGHDETSEDLASAFTERQVSPGVAQIINVTFQLNTSTNLDTLGENGFVEIRGALNGQTGPVLPGGKTIDWSAASDLELSNTGGDYWAVTFAMEPGDTLNYKFWTGFDASNGTIPDGGWEGPFNPSNGINTDTRTFICGNSDSTLPLQFYHPNVGGAKVDQFFRPFESKPDTLAIYFRVNLGGITETAKFDPAVNGPAGVRGGAETSGGTIDWGETRVLLTREVDSVDDGSFWSGVAYVPKDSVLAGSTQKYKFFIENNGGIDWEGSVNPDDIDGNRTFDYTANLLATMDTTLHWVYFNNQAPTGTQVIESTVTFRLNLKALEDIGLFDRSLDEVAVIGAKGWDRPDDLIKMNFIPALQEWTVAEPFTARPGDKIFYKYFVLWDSSRVDSTSGNFIPALRSLDNGWEEPSVEGGGNRVLVFQNAPQQNPDGDFGFDQQFFASVPPGGVINHHVTVTWNINMTPATDAATNPNPLFRPGIDSVFVQFDGSLLAVTQGFGIGGTDARVVKLEDPDNDGIYSGSLEFMAPLWYQVGYIIAYSTDSGYITNGGGFDKGRRYYQFIRPDKVNDDLTVEYPSSFDFPVLDWMEKNLTVEDPPDLTKPTAIETNGDEIPQSFALLQNYPNPFNPDTRIRYQVARTSAVKIQIYNLMGQLVKTLVDEKQSAGSFAVVWHGDNDQGQQVSSGVYFLKMKAGDFNGVRKMALVR
ncbi:MAG: FlgD immunoglobulin-like domain containing protein [bacterium]